MWARLTRQQVGVARMPHGLWSLEKLSPWQYADVNPRDQYPKKTKNNCSISKFVYLLSPHTKGRVYRVKIVNGCDNEVHVFVPKKEKGKKGMCLCDYVQMKFVLMRSNNTKGWRISAEKWFRNFGKRLSLFSADVLPLELFGCISTNFTHT